MNIRVILSANSGFFTIRYLSIDMNAIVDILMNPKKPPIKP